MCVWERPQYNTPPSYSLVSIHTHTHTPGAKVCSCICIRRMRRENVDTLLHKVGNRVQAILTGIYSNLPFEQDLNSYKVPNNIFFRITKESISIDVNAIC